MAKTTGYNDLVYAEIGSGVRQRKITSIPFILANVRTNMTAPNHVLADAIPGETSFGKGVFIAPCRGRILKVSVNAAAFPVNGGAANTITVDVQKAVIGDSDVSVLASPIEIENSTAETALHGTLSATSGAIDFIEGQEIYAIVAVSADAITTRSDGAVITIEWMPLEN